MRQRQEELARRGDKRLRITTASVLRPLIQKNDVRALERSADRRGGGGCSLARSRASLKIVAASAKLEGSASDRATNSWLYRVAFAAIFLVSMVLLDRIGAPKRAGLRRWVNTHAVHLFTSRYSTRYPRVPAWVLRPLSWGTL